jgi:hypothetical protein
LRIGIRCRLMVKDDVAFDCHGCVMGVSWRCRTQYFGDKRVSLAVSPMNSSWMLLLQVR